MSSRQMRRLQHLVDASTGADADDAWAVEDTQMPSTMKPTGAAGEKKRKGQKKSTTSKPAPATPATAPPAAMPQSSGAHDGRMECELPVTDKTVSTTEPGAATSASARKQASPKPAVPAPAHAAKPSVPAKKKAKGKRHAAQVEDEEDALLEAVLQQRAEEAAATVSSDPMAPDTSDASRDLLRLLVECDPTRLDTRIERVRSFGANAVEDYGDNLTTSRMPDGQPRDNGTHSLFPEHRGRFHFKKSAFASPNRYRWPPFDNEDTFLEVVEPDANAATTGASSSTWPLIFRLHTHTPAYTRAERARTEAVEGLGNVQVLVNCLANHGAYHVPTLLQLRETFQLMNDPLRAHEMVDIALYFTGILLSRFPLARTWRARQLPAKQEAPMGTASLHAALWAGIHVALSRGCMRAAFELNRFLLSLDPDDVMGALLLLDYTALRAKRWVWLLEAFSLLRTASAMDHAYPEQLLSEQVMPETQPSPYACLNAASFPGEQAWDMQQTARWLCLSPGLAFSAALARHMLEREEAVYAEELQQNPAAKKPKVLKEMTTAQIDVVRGCPSAAEMLTLAALWYPQAAQALVRELGGIETVCRGQAPSGLWSVIEEASDVFSAATAAAPSTLSAALGHSADLFAARAAEMWKAPEVMQFLRTVLTRDTEVREPNNGNVVDVASRVHALRDLLDNLAVADPVLGNATQRYMHLTAAHLRGDAPTALPADLLNGEDDEDGPDLGAVGLEALMRNAAGGLAPDVAHMDHNALLRYRALYGVYADPDDQGTAEELREFRARFEAEDGLRVYLAPINPLVLAFRAMAPGNNMESMALEQALDAQGIEDPVRAERDANRARDAAMWEADNEEAWATGDDEEDEFWEADDSDDM